MPFVVSSAVCAEAMYVSELLAERYLSTLQVKGCAVPSANLRHAIVLDLYERGSISG